MNNLFLVRSLLTTREYMRDGQDVREELDLVVASDAAQAERKVMEHYESKSDDYGTTYSCLVVSVKPAIA